MQIKMVNPFDRIVGIQNAINKLHDRLSSLKFQIYVTGYMLPTIHCVIVDKI